MRMMSVAAWGTIAGMRSSLLIFGVGMLMGGVLGRRPVEPDEPPPATPPAEAPRVVDLELPSDCDGRLAALDAEIARIEGELRATRLTARMQEAARVEREGEPVPWPDDVDPRLAPEAIRAAFAAAAEASAVAVLHDVECDEFPCLLTLEMTTPHVGRGLSLGEYEPVFEALGWDDLGMVAGMASGLGNNGDAGRFGVFAWGPDGLPPEVLKRAAFRIRKEVEATHAELEAR